MRDAAALVWPHPVLSQLVEAGATWIATPFHWEACLKRVGVDCKGVLRGVAIDCGRPEAEAIEARVIGYSRRIDEAAFLAGLDRVFVRQPDGCELQPGDVLAFRIQGKVQHVALHSFGDRFIHAYSGTPRQVVEVTLGQFWRNRLAGVWGWRDLASSSAAVGR